MKIILRETDFNGKLPPRSEQREAQRAEVADEEWVAAAKAAAWAYANYIGGGPVTAYEADGEHKIVTVGFGYHDE